MRLETERLTLRPVALADGQDLLAAMECPEVHAMHSNQFTGPEAVEGYIRVLDEEYGRGLYRTLAIAEGDGNRLAGLITLDRDRIFPRAELSYWIARECRSRGLATEAVRALAVHGLTVLGLRRVQATVSTSKASARVLEKAGMRCEGTLRQYIGFGEEFHDCRMYSMVTADLT